MEEQHSLPNSPSDHRKRWLRNNSGPTKTYALVPGSPANDAIPPDACHITVPTRDHLGTPIDKYTITADQRGMKRPDENEQFCDNGAFE